MGDAGRTVASAHDGDPFEALGVPHRRELLRLLAEGTRRSYHLHEQGLQAVQAYLERVGGDAAARFQIVADHMGNESDL